MSVEGMVALGISVLTFFLLLYNIIYKQARIESRVDIIWAFIMRQGLSSGILGGLMEKNSPLKLSVDVLKRHQDLVTRAREWYATQPYNLSDLELFIRLEQKFSVELNEMCITERVLPGGCTAAMLFLLRPDAEMFKKYNHDEWLREQA